MLNRVRLTGATPKLVPLHVENDEWRLDPTALRKAVGPRTRAIFLVDPAFPTGHRLSDDEWGAVVDVCREHGRTLLYWASYEGVVYDGRQIVHPLTFAGMEDRTVVIGSVSFEQRVIGWRVGWVLAPGALAEQAARVHIYNGLVASGFAQIGAAAALREPDSDLAKCVAEWQRRRDTVLEQLDELPVVRPAGSWALLLDVAALALDCSAVSERLLREKVAATPMRGWGGDADRHIRFVFGNEPVERLRSLGERVRAALA